jgi:competence protein ComEC
VAFFVQLPAIVWLTAAFAGGIALAEWVQPSLANATALVAGCAAFWAVCYVIGRPSARLLGAIVSFAALGLAHAALQVSRQPLWPQPAAGHHIVARGVVDDEAEASASGGWRATVLLTGLDVGSAVPRFVSGRRGRHSLARQPPVPAQPSLQPVSALVRVNGKGHPPAAGVGAEVLVRGRFRLGQPAGNPGERSEQAALRRRGMVGVVQADPDNGITVLRPGGWSVRSAIAAMRQRVVDGALRILPAPYGGLLLSLLLGIDTYLTPDLYQQFARAGLVHLLVVSGAQVAIVAGACAWAAQSARLPVAPSVAITGLSVAAFAAMVGWAPSVGRAVIMTSVALVAPLAGRQTDRAATLATAALVLLAIDPTVLFDIGFHLSFAATWGLLFVTPALQRQLAVLGPKPAAVLGVTLGAQMAVAPLLAVHFQSVPVAGLVANILVLPLIAALTPAGFAFMLLVVAAPAIGEPLLRLLQPGLRAILWIATRFGSLSWATVPTPPVPPIAAAAFFALLGSGVSIGSGSWKPPPRARAVFAAAGALIVAIWYVAATRPPSALTVTVLDVGQGDSILIQSPAGSAMLIDGGGEVGAEKTGWDIGLMRVVPALRRAGVRRLDVVVLTHPHEDHVGGLPAVVENFPVGLVLDPGVPHPSPSYTRFLRVVEARRIPYRLAREGIVVDLGAGVRVTILYPPEPIPHVGGTPVHEGSVVARITFGRTAALLTGDLEAPGERYLLERGAPLDAQVLKVGHHGSHTSTSPEFLARVQPQIAVISVGTDNACGHPHQTTLDALAAARVTTFRTDLDGAVRLTSDGAAWRVTPARDRIGARFH